MSQASHRPINKKQKSQCLKNNLGQNTEQEATGPGVASKKPGLKLSHTYLWKILENCVHAHCCIHSEIMS